MAEGGHIDGSQYTVDPLMSVAISIGSINPPDRISSLVASTCDSGNCTFNAFETVGICSSCDDVSRYIGNLSDSSGQAQVVVSDFTLLDSTSDKSTVWVGSETISTLR